MHLIHQTGQSTVVALQEPALVQKQKDHHPKLDLFFRTSTTKHKEKAEEALRTAKIVDLTDGHEISKKISQAQLLLPPKSLKVEQVFQQAPPLQ